MSTNKYCHGEDRETDDLLDALSHHIRREIINYFENYSDEEMASFEDLHSRIRKKFPNKDGKQLSTNLHHKHIPKMEDRDWLEFDHRSGIIRYYGQESPELLLNDVSEIFKE